MVNTCSFYCIWTLFCFLFYCIIVLYWFDDLILFDLFHEFVCVCARACEMFNFILHRLYFVLIYFILIYVIFVFYFMLFLLFLITFVFVVFSSWYYFFILLQCISIVFYLFILLEFNLVALDLFVEGPLRLHHTERHVWRHFCATGRGEESVMASGPAELQSGDDAELDELLDSKVKIKIPTVKPNKHWHFRA